MKEKSYKSFKEFYPFYLSQHQNSICKILHYIGSWLVLFILAYSIITKGYSYIFLCPVIGYFFAWVGHFFFEKNVPDTFTYPLYSFMGDWKMFYEITLGRVRIKPSE